MKCAPRAFHWHHIGCGFSTGSWNPCGLRGSIDRSITLRSLQCRLFHAPYPRYPYLVPYPQVGRQACLCQCSRIGNGSDNVPQKRRGRFKSTRECRAAPFQKFPSSHCENGPSQARAVMPFSVFPFGLHFRRFVESPKSGDQWRSGPSPVIGGKYADICKGGKKPKKIHSKSSKEKSITWDLREQILLVSARYLASASRRGRSSSTLKIISEHFAHATRCVA